MQLQALLTFFNSELAQAKLCTAVKSVVAQAPKYFTKSEATSRFPQGLQDTISETPESCRISKNPAQLQLSNSPGDLEGP
jgi:hypothetical protein